MYGFTQQDLDDVWAEVQGLSSEDMLVYMEMIETLLWPHGEDVRNIEIAQRQFNALFWLAEQKEKDEAKDSLQDV